MAEADNPIHCPVCHSRASDIVDSRTVGADRRRRRRCLKCDERWTTHEISSAHLQAIVQVGATLRASEIALRAALGNVELLQHDLATIREDYGLDEQSNTDAVAALHLVGAGRRTGRNLP